MHKHYNGYKMKKASLFDRDKVIAFVALLLVVAVIGFAVGSCCKGEDQLATCWVMCKPGSRVSVRLEPSKKSPEIGFLECGDSFQTDGESIDGWISCLGVGETNGWIYCGYVCTEKPEIIGERYVCVAKKQVACRKWIGGPKIEAKSWLKNGQNVYVFCIGDGWAVTSRGYVRSDWIEVDPE